MLSTDRDALECDLMETYHIEDMKELPPTRVALFASGLRDDSRIKMKLAGAKVPLETLILAKITDALDTLVWMQTKSGMKGQNRPKSITKALSGTQEKEKEVETYSSPDEFIKAREMLIERTKNV